MPILGWYNDNGVRTLWGYYINNGNPDCGTADSHPDLKRRAWPRPTTRHVLIGYFRIMNHKIFAQYMSDRYYDEVFYASRTAGSA